MQEQLAGRTIVITRAASQSSEFVQLLEQHGAKVINCPTIKIAAPDNCDRLDEAIDHLYGYDWIIFTSTNGVEYFLRRLASLAKTVADLDDLRVCAVGEATANKLRDNHVHVDVVPATFKAEGVFDALVEFLGGDDQLTNLNVLMPRAAIGRDYLPKKLEAAGARVDVVTTYQTVVPPDLDRGKLAAMLAGGADCIAFTSSSTVKNLGLLFDTHDLSQTLRAIAVACIGDVTAATAADYGLTVDILPHDFTVSALAEAIVEFYK